MVIPSDSVIVTAVAAGGASSAMVDLHSRRVPNALTFGIAALGLALAAMRVSSVGVGGAVVGGLAGLLLMLPGHIAGATGAGDVKLFAALGTLLGPARMGPAFLYTALVGAILAIVVATNRRRLAGMMERTAALIRTSGGAAAEIEHGSHDNRFAYAPAIAVGALAAALGL